ncbi:MAG TPA: ATP-binding protein [Holophagaceae bacterium]|nr:ATP-binding protein [Holophagaceae bacterium]
MPLRHLFPWALLACLWAFPPARAQQPTQPLNLLEAGRPKFRAFGVKEGLPNSTIMAVTLDQDGLLWVGTQDGAACYDGRTWTMVDMPDRRIGNYVHAVLPASDGSLWFARQEGGVARLKEGTWTTWSVAEGLPADRVHSLLETREPSGKSAIWAATYGGGVARWDGSRWAKVELPLKSLKLWKLSPVPGRPEALWVAGESGTLARVGPGGVEAVEGLPNVSINQVLQRTGLDGTEEVWVSTYGAGVARHTRGRWTFFQQAEGLPDTFCTDLAETVSRQGDRTLWVTTHGGLAFLEGRGTRFQAFTFRSGLPTETLYRLFVQHSPDGPYTLWVGSSGAGLLALREGGWRTHDAYSGLAGSVAWGLAEVNEGKHPVLLAASGRGLSAFNGRGWTTWPVPRVLQGVRINALLTRTLPGGTSELWVGALGGLARYRGGAWRTFGAADGLAIPAVSALAATQDAEGAKVWAGSTRGLMVLRGERWEPVGGDPEFREVVVDTLLDGGLSEGSSVLWVGTRGNGLWRLHKGRLTRFSREGGQLPSNLVTHLLMTLGPAGARELWVGTNGGGVCILDPDHPERGGITLTSRSVAALPSDAVQAIAATRDGAVWLATNLGVARVAPRDPRAPEQLSLRVFTEDDGLPSAIANPHAILVDQGGRIWVGTRSGVGMLDPSRLPEDASRPPLRLRKVMVNGQGVPGAERLETFELKPSERRISFSYALLSYFGEQNIRYRAQLEGLEDHPTDWVAGGEREFVNLRPGSYRLKVWARDGRGPVPGALEFSFQVLPSFWQRPLVQAALGLLLVGLLITSLRTRERLHLVRNARLEAEVVERTSALTHLNDDLQREVQERRAAERVKDEFISVVSHELRTPLTAIRGALGLLATDSVNLPEGQRGNLMEMARRNTERLLHLVNDLLDMKRIESGGVELDLKPLSLPGLLAEALAVNGPYAQGLGVSLALELEEIPAKVVGDGLRVAQVLANLLSNATKFSRKEGVVRLGAWEEGASVRIWVMNTGDPIPEAFRGRIFEKFAQAESGSTRDVRGTGLGLAISKALVEAMGGTIGFESKPEGTTFWFTLPKA